VNLTLTSLMPAIVAQTDSKGDSNFDVSSPAGDDFLSRERAVLGDDATQFASKNDNAAFIDDDNEDDLLGGGNNDEEEVTEFQHAYPAVNAPDNVRTRSLYPFNVLC
jgi:hypothetical protein